MYKVILAIGLATLLMITVFRITLLINELSLQTQALSHLQDNLRFINFFLRREIHKAGSGFCQPKKRVAKMTAVKTFLSSEASHLFAIDALKSSNVLMIRECVHINGQFKYLPIFFYVSKGRTLDKKSPRFSSLYYQIGSHPREKLMDNVSHFLVTLNTRMADVLVQYQLISSKKILKFPISRYLKLNNRIYANVMTFSNA